MSTAAFTKLPFDEAIEFLRDKVRLPSEHWTDLWHGMHSHGFVVSGGIRDKFLADVQTSLIEAMDKGTTLQQFKKDFPGIVQKHGWTGSAKSPVDTPGRLGWRAGVIFETNVATAYAAGHYKQMTDPAVLKARPYWRYIGGLSMRPRPLHKAWSGTILRSDDPWWDTHYPPNGWGCKCRVVSVGNREMQREGWKVDDTAPDDGASDWTNPNTGAVETVPNGIDPGWAYNPGKAAWGEKLSTEAMAAWKAQGAKVWEPLTFGSAATEGRAEIIPLDNAKARLDASIPETSAGMESELEKILGGKNKVFSFQSKDFRYDILVSAKSLAEHIDPNRAPYLPLIKETLTDPYEVWMSFERHRGTGQVVLRQRIVKAVNVGGKEGLLFVTEARDGMMEGWTFVPVSKLSYLNKQRRGKLIWGR